MSGREGREFGSKVGSAGVASQQNEDIQRKERLRQLALETIDLSKDPYFRKNHHGTFDCTLCLTVHNDEGNYLTHTQGTQRCWVAHTAERSNAISTGKRHQSNLARRAFREAKAMPTTFLAVQAASKYKVRCCFAR
jgi:splicing factor 3A subunit 2